MSLQTNSITIALMLKDDIISTKTITVDLPCTIRELKLLVPQLGLWPVITSSANISKVKRACGTVLDDLYSLQATDNGKSFVICLRKESTRKKRKFEDLESIEELKVEVQRLREAAMELEAQLRKLEDLEIELLLAPRVGQVSLIDSSDQPAPKRMKLVGDE